MPTALYPTIPLDLPTIRHLQAELTYYVRAGSSRPLYVVRTLPQTHGRIPHTVAYLQETHGTITIHHALSDREDPTSQTYSRLGLLAVIHNVRSKHGWITFPSYSYTNRRIYTEHVPRITKVLLPGFRLNATHGIPFELPNGHPLTHRSRIYLDGTQPRYPNRNGLGRGNHRESDGTRRPRTTTAGNTALL